MVTTEHVNCMEREQEITYYYRWQHWIRALSITALVFTGFYIAVPYIAPIQDPEPANFMNALFRFWHIAFGFVLAAVVAFKSYLFVFARNHGSERKALLDAISPKIWVKQLGYYLFISKHPHLRGMYNPLQFAAYAGFYVAMFFLILTGFILYAHVYHNGFAGLIYPAMRFFEALFGGIANVRMIHHVFMWFVIIFVVIHVYMAVFNAIYGKNGSMDAIFSGFKWKKENS
ncbi:MAG: Ni/Fe-hydrogenase, b-type cytochrome subunit [Helicobacteraceae bacterium]